MEKNKIKDSLLETLKGTPDQAFTVQELAESIRMTDAGKFKFVVQALAQLEHDKVITLNQNGTFTIAKDDSLPVLTGIFHANDHGYGFATVDPETPDFFINPTQTLSALNGDEVELVMLHPADKVTGRGPEGKITGIVHHSLEQVVGEFQVDVDENYPHGIIGKIRLKDRKLANYRFLVEDKGLKPVPGEVVLADITAYPDAHLPGILKGVVKKVIGNVNDPGMDILQVVYQHDIPTKFPDDVMQEVEQIPDHVTEVEKAGREDLTNQDLVTIDSIESKDLDDAVTAWKLPNGNYHLGVHIADVSHYVVPGTALNAEAYERGTSVYLTDRVIPMLPHKLSNGICSLNPQVERLAMSCEMEIDPTGQVIKHRIFPSVIKTTERMTYVAINKILESQDEKTMKRYAKLVPMFQTMGELHKILLKMRKHRGAIEFEDTEAKIIVDEKGHPTDIQLRERGISERIVESFMLAANETIAAHFNNLKVPFIYRIHEKPKAEKMLAFFEALSGLGIEATGSSSDVKPKMLQNILKKAAGKPEEAMVSTMLLRSMQQAKYADQPVGHFGLGADDYTHFTSPIRRYPDLLVHRLIRFYEENGVNAETKEEYKEEIPEIATHSSQMERRAIDAERDTDAMKKAEYMADHVGEEFEAVVSSVTKFGMFVSLQNTVEGLIHISEMKDDYYEYLEKQMALVGRHTKRTYRIGQPLSVKVINVNVEQKEIDFTLLHPENTPKTDLLKNNSNFKRNDRNKRPAQGNKKYNKSGKRGSNYKKFHGNQPFKDKFKRHK
ncbi:ribonuclease R [Liquorilactobacillus capillatus]|uniref:Ribonuclease R n=1 Tax=Liquorilactobacillus capillatus DSM 19910 TaxID=1423731 RepID=A0A0R1M4J8_9LACO|nr:ribonuclease R [Liquorilactobacillus capillatus]KRL02991.1 ribonuclease R [Liquorilactobacillus capillatus DSM 19910]